MSELRDLYQESLLRHSRQPACPPTLDHPTHRAEGRNPLCGDRIELELEVREGTLRDLGFRGEGCIISRGAASMLYQELRGRDLESARVLGEALVELLEAPSPESIPVPESLLPLREVRDYPTRIRCATLAWRTYLTALASPHGEEPDPPETS